MSARAARPSIAGTLAPTQSRGSALAAERLRRLQDAASSGGVELTRYPNVSYVTLGQKRVGGRRTREAALVVYVGRKGGVEPADAVPRECELRLASGRKGRVATDVVELPDLPRVFGMRAGHILRAGDGDRGVCGLTVSRNRKQFMVTNAHVVADMRRQMVYGIPAVLDPSSLRYFPVGKVVYATSFAVGVATNEDMAIVQVTGVRADAMGIVNEDYPIAGFGTFEEALNARYWYSVNGVRFECGFPEPLIPGKQVPILVDGLWMPYTGFWQLQMMAGASSPGQSGALICRGRGRNIEACGLLFGGVSPGYVYAFPIAGVISRLTEELG